ncbi:hypothetical protein [Dokdonella sp.]|uniref:hypothetical protein n=1 Tax=Dokdonella sp. TaxID=2291710 RepID=UPI003C5D8B1C
MNQEHLVGQEPQLHESLSPRSTIQYPPPPELGDVIDALDDAAASLKSVVRSQTRSVVDEVGQYVRAQPLMALAIAGSVGYLIARIRR